MGALLLALGMVGAVVFSFRAAGSMMGRGEERRRIAAQAAYARLVRESPTEPDARLSEAEYVQKHMKKSPSVIGNWLLAMLSLFLLLPLGCVVMAAS